MNTTPNTNIETEPVMPLTTDKTPVIVPITMGEKPKETLSDGAPLAMPTTIDVKEMADTDEGPSIDIPNNVDELDIQAPVEPVAETPVVTPVEEKSDKMPKEEIKPEVTDNEDKENLDVAPAIERITAMINATENRIRNLQNNQRLVQVDMVNAEKKNADIERQMAASQSILDGLKANLDQLQQIQTFAESTKTETES